MKSINNIEQFNYIQSSDKTQSHSDIILDQITKILSSKYTDIIDTYKNNSKSYSSYQFYINNQDNDQDNDQDDQVDDLDNDQVDDQDNNDQGNDNQDNNDQDNDDQDNNDQDNNDQDNNDQDNDNLDDDTSTITSVDTYTTQNTDDIQSYLNDIHIYEQHKYILDTYGNIFDRDFLQYLDEQYSYVHFNKAIIINELLKTNYIYPRTTPCDGCSNDHNHSLQLVTCGHSFCVKFIIEWTIIEFEDHHNIRCPTCDIYYF